jgi:hypothetical protein
MSTDFRPLTPIRMADLFDGRLEDVGVHEHHSKEALWGRCTPPPGGDHPHAWHVRAAVTFHTNESVRIVTEDRALPNSNPHPIMETSR